MNVSRSLLNKIDLLVVFIFELLFLGLAVWAIEIGDMGRFSTVLVSMAVILVPIVLEKVLKIVLPFGVKSLISMSLFLHIAGGVMRWYWSPTFPLYNQVAHFVSGMAVGLIIFVFFIFLDAYGIRFKRSTILVSIFLLMAFFGGLWKIGEVSSDVFYHTYYNDGLSNLIACDFSHTIGSIAAVAVSWLYFLSIPEGEGLYYLLRPLKKK